jgi:hypothetical protein
MIGLLSVLLAGYELFAWGTSRRTISRARGVWRVGVFAWFAALGAHLVIEAAREDAAERASTNWRW